MNRKVKIYEAPEYTVCTEEVKTTLQGHTDLIRSAVYWNLPFKPTTLLCVRYFGGWFEASEWHYNLVSLLEDAYNDYTDYDTEEFEETLNKWNDRQAKANGASLAEIEG